MEYRYSGSGVAPPPPKRRRINVTTGNEGSWGELPAPRSFLRLFSPRPGSPVRSAHSSSNNVCSPIEAIPRISKSSADSRSSKDGQHHNAPSTQIRITGKNLIPPRYVTLTYTNPASPSYSSRGDDPSMDGDPRRQQQAPSCHYDHGTSMTGPSNNFHRGNYSPAQRYLRSTLSNRTDLSHRRLGRRSVSPRDDTFHNSSGDTHESVAHPVKHRRHNPLSENLGLSRNGSFVHFTLSNTPLDKTASHPFPEASSNVPRPFGNPGQTFHSNIPNPRTRNEDRESSLDPTLRTEADQSPHGRDDFNQQYQNDLEALERAQQQMLDMLHAFKNQSASEVASPLPEDSTHTRNMNLSRTLEDFLQWKRSMSCGSDQASLHDENQDSNNPGSVGQPAVSDIQACQQSSLQSGGAYAEHQLPQVARELVDPRLLDSSDPAEEEHDPISPFSNVGQSEISLQGPDQIHTLAGAAPPAEAAPLGVHVAGVISNSALPNTTNQQQTGAHPHEQPGEVFQQPSENLQQGVLVPDQGDHPMNPGEDPGEMHQLPLSQEAQPMTPPLHADPAVAAELEVPGHVQDPEQEPLQIGPPLEAPAPALPEPPVPPAAAAAPVGGDGQAPLICKKRGCTRPRQHQTSRSRFCTIHLLNGMPRARGGGPNQIVLAAENYCTGCNGFRLRRAPGKSCWDCFCKCRRQKNDGVCAGCPGSRCPNHIAEEDMVE
ncbi:hypothetical protein B0T20DRAFT_478748 [Sordaria brevicollis]|uniref:Uncharacterized protein n=1 Tax=Sordaria brevicollis TaxID=83679 RepID=A0AAE0PG83_SORBR|nr:hypothetical protein B0T20DRAFT_478748 [Sordaria brevicollis]